MSAATADPESLTVVKLKESLRATGVSFPNNALKAELVKLYRANIVGGTPPSAPATPAALTTSAATKRTRSPARGRKSPAREAAPAPTPSTPKAHAISHTAHTSPPGSGGGLRIISTQPLRPTGAPPAPAAIACSTPSPPAPAPVSRRQPTPPLPSPLPSPILPVASQNLDVEPVQRPPSPPPAAPAAAAAPAPAARHEEPEPANYSPVLFWAIVAVEVLLTLAALHLGFALLTALVTPHKFCDTNASVIAGCIACPEHGACTNGQLACDVGFVQRGKSCIEDSRIAKQAYKAGAALRAHLQQQSGQAECANLPLPVSVTSEEAKAITLKTLGDKTPGDGDVFSLVYERVKAKAQELDLAFDTAAERWTTTAAPIRPFSCEFKAFVRHHFLTIALAFALLVLVLWVYVWLAREKRNHDLVQATFIEVLSILAENPSFPFAVSHIRDQVARAGTPQARLWRRVEEAVESDSRVGKEQQMVQHIQTTTWRWVAGPLSPRRQSFT